MQDLVTVPGIEAGDTDHATSSTKTFFQLKLYYVVDFIEEQKCLFLDFLLFKTLIVLIWSKHLYDTRTRRVASKS